jgi:hypothetical protein
MDNIGKKLELGNYYYLSTFGNEIVKYIGNSHKIEGVYLFEWKNTLNKKIVIRRRFYENDILPISIDKYNTDNDNDTDTDNEFLEDPY